jgi:ADP-ribose pyrophosphatase
MHIYLATNLRSDPLPGDEDEFITVEAVALANMPDLIAQGVLQDAKSLAALFLAEPYLKNISKN